MTYRRFAVYAFNLASLAFAVAMLYVVLAREVTP